MFLLLELLVQVVVGLWRYFSNMTFINGSFFWGIGVYYTVEAEMMGFIIASENASDFNCSKLLIESNSSYIVNLFNKGIGKILWQLRDRWTSAIHLSQKLNIIVTHI